MLIERLFSIAVSGVGAAVLLPALAQRPDPPDVAVPLGSVIVAGGIAMGTLAALSHAQRSARVARLVVWGAFSLAVSAVPAFAAARQPDWRMMLYGICALLPLAAFALVLARNPQP